MWILIASAIGAQVITDGFMQWVDMQNDVYLPLPTPPTPPTPREVARRIRRNVLRGVWGVVGFSLAVCWLLVRL
jgi:hypothetical protein